MEETRFKPGQSGNPKGRPKGTGGPYMTRILKELLEQDIDIKNIGDLKRFFDIKGTKMTNKHAIMFRLLKKAHDGDSKAIEVLLDRIDGKVTQPLEHSGDIQQRPDLSHLSLDELKAILQE